MWTAIYGRGNDYVLAREVIRIDIRSELGLGAVAVGQQFFLVVKELFTCCLLYTSPSPRDRG